MPHQTEKSVWDGAGESQDTLFVAQRLMMGFGVGLRSSSPAPVETLITLSFSDQSDFRSDAARESKPFRFRADTEEVGFLRRF
ncbi:hypothetical protein VTH06DRAFT_6903 [Thermothelomyces fergusii]